MRREISRNAKSRGRKREISRRVESLAGGEFDRHRPDLRAQGRGLDAEQPRGAAGAGNLPVAGLERAARMLSRCRSRISSTVRIGLDVLYGKGIMIEPLEEYDSYDQRIAACLDLRRTEYRKIMVTANKSAGSKPVASLSPDASLSVSKTISSSKVTLTPASLLTRIGSNSAAWPLARKVTVPSSSTEPLSSTMDEYPEARSPTSQIKAESATRQLPREIVSERCSHPQNSGP